jgi:acetyl-CoA synthase
MHTGQRNLIRTRVSNAAYDAGFRAKHMGEMLYAKIKSDYDPVVDKCQITIITDPAECTRLKNELAMPAYDARDVRLANLTDEAADVFYTCTLCQSFSPSHVCIVTPERLGLCGAVSWLDAKATNQLNPNGPCQVVSKEGVIDEHVGIWPDVNRAVREYSQGALEHVTLYSIIQDPMTSCGCFECICGLEPASNGGDHSQPRIRRADAHRHDLRRAGLDDRGRRADSGLYGPWRHFIGSKKFMRAEGGVARIVWMPKMLKDAVADRLNKAAFELYGIENYTDMICDETIASTVDELDKMLEFLAEKGHPALGMEPMV